MPDHYTTLRDHYVQLAMTTGWEAYTWRRLKDLAQQCPELYAQLPADVTELVARSRESSEPPVKPGA